MFRTARLIPLLLLAGCSVIPESYTVQQDGKAEIGVRIKGGDGVSTLALRDVIHDYMLDLSTDPGRDSAAFDAMLELENIFELNGFPLVSVKYGIEREKGTKVVFTIEQGKQVLLEKCTIAGGSIDTDELLAYLPRRKSEILGLGGDVYVAADIQTLRQGIISHYQREGYLDAAAEIEGPTPPLTKDTERVSVTVRVTPGQRYKVGEITVDESLAAILTGNTAAIARDDPDAGPSAPKTKLEPGGPFRARDVQEYALAMRSYFRQWGYPDPQIQTSVTVLRPPEPNPYTVSVRLQGQAGEPVIVERIDIEGHDFASEGNIRQRISLQTGKRFDGRKEEDSLRRLYRSGLFRTVEIRYLPLAAGRIAVVFKVQETTRYLLQPLVGAGSYERIRGGLEFEMLSVFGTDFDFRTSGIASDRGHRVTASVADSEFFPALFGPDTTLSISVDDYRREEPSYNDGATGFSPTLSKLLTEDTSVRFAYLIRDHSDTFSTVDDPGARIGPYREGSLVLEIAYDSRDNPVMPKRGSRIALQHKWADDSLGGDVSFHRTRLTLSHLFELSKRLRFVVRAEGGILDPEDGIDTIPIQERFFNGGESTVRSFEEDQLAGPALRDSTGQVRGGLYRNVFNAELRWAPPIDLVNVFDLEFALFGDAGNLGLQASDYDVDDLKYAVGAGIRFLLPIGPVRFDYAHNPDREPGERDWTFHFSIGYAF